VNHIGDLVWVKQDRKFPITLRSGPGYTFNIIELLEPGQVGLVTHQQRHSGSSYWVSILTAMGNVGWVPLGIMNILNQQSNL